MLTDLADPLKKDREKDREGGVVISIQFGCFFPSEQTQQIHEQLHNRDWTTICVSKTFWVGYLA